MRHFDTMASTLVTELAKLCAAKPVNDQNRFVYWIYGRFATKSFRSKSFRYKVVSLQSRFATTLSRFATHIKSFRYANTSYLLFMFCLIYYSDKYLICTKTAWERAGDAWELRYMNTRQHLRESSLIVFAFVNIEYASISHASEQSKF